MMSIHPGTFLTVFGPASDKLIMNSKALRRRVECSLRLSSFPFSSIEFCELDGPGDEGDNEVDRKDSEGGGKMNTPFWPSLIPPFPWKCHPLSV